MNKNCCPICEFKISKKWLYTSNYNKDYVCSKCNNIIAWNKYRKISTGISTFFSIFISTTLIRYSLIEKLKFSRTYKALLVGISVLVLWTIINFFMEILLPRQFNIKRIENNKN